MNDNNAKILAIETSGCVGSVALGLGPQVVAEKKFTAKFQHASQLLPTIDSLCREQDWSPEEIKLVCISAGPGSFTGLRIAVTAAKTIAYANNVPVVAVSSTDVLAMGALEAENNDEINIRYLAVVLDAKRKQVYAASFEQIGSEKVENSDSNVPFLKKNSHNSHPIPYGMNLEDRFLPGFHHIMAPCTIGCEALLSELPRPLYLLGEGLAVHRQALSGPGITHLDEQYWPAKASNVIRCGWLMAQAECFVDPDRLLPFYLRRPEAVERWEKIHGK